MTRIKRGGKVQPSSRIAPLAKPAETRSRRVVGRERQAGRVLFEMSYPNEEIAREALRRAMHKLPCKCRIVTREEQF